MSDALTVGSINTVQSTQTAWPDHWTCWPNTYVYPTYVQTPNRQDEYANEVEVEQNEHDATLRFYRTHGATRTLIKELTVPLGVLEWLQGQA